MPPLLARAAFCAPLLLLSTLLAAQSRDTESYSAALPEHAGQLHWEAPGFKITQNSAKPKGSEIGFRGVSLKSHVGYLAFLFLFPDQAPMTSAKCSDGVMQPLERENPTVKVLEKTETHPSTGPAVVWISYSNVGKAGSVFYHLRGFAASSDICGDMEITSDAPIDAEEPEIKAIRESYRLDPEYKPGFADIYQYALVLYKMQIYPAAAPLFAKALSLLGKESDGKPFPSEQVARRVTTDQAGISYGIAGDYEKARSIFEHGIAGDPDYPLYYYNLACADAGENKLADAEKHLGQAFARKANLIAGETMPDPTKDDSFLPYQSNQSFWQALEKLSR